MDGRDRGGGVWVDAGADIGQQGSTERYCFRDLGDNERQAGAVGFDLLPERRTGGATNHDELLHLDKGPHTCPRNLRYTARYV